MVSGFLLRRFVRLTICKLLKKVSQLLCYGFPTPHQSSQIITLAEKPRFMLNRKLFGYQYLLYLVEKDLSDLPQSIFTEKLCL